MSRGPITIDHKATKNRKKRAVSGNRGRWRSVQFGSDRQSSGSDSKVCRLLYSNSLSVSFCVRQFLCECSEPFEVDINRLKQALSLEMFWMILSTFP